ncbi:hypothetical protein [Usitatibacter palustris]|uniref:Uncharacterized protein n=1 Tax=Usitatibacter palustris TaxID=2732487 RepID=A0A6M4H665_9PROT|nr:hypothetical protein [Usitatibacter palustris]QJR15116.1 hypothetical protein DSM104440_01933 [Usitatibacter palustris]
MNFVNIPLSLTALVVGIVLGHAAAAPVTPEPAPARYSAAAWSVAHAAIVDNRDDPAAPEISSTF